MSKLPNIVPEPIKEFYYWLHENYGSRTANETLELYQEFVMAEENESKIDNTVKRFRKILEASND